MTDSNEGLPIIGGDVSTSVSDAVVTAAIQDLSLESEEFLTLRYRRLPKKPEKLTFEFTRDPALLHQYYRIYEEQFRAVHNAYRYHHDSEDEHDRMSHILVARDGNMCVGGARLSVKTPRQPHLMPIEIDGFRLDDHFPQLHHKEMRYGQIGRFCLLPDFRGGDVTRMLLWRLYRKSVAMNLDMIFGTAPLSNARAYMKNFAAMGLQEPKIHFGIDLPKYPMCEEIKFYLLSVVVPKQKNAADESFADEEDEILSREKAEL